MTIVDSGEIVDIERLMNIALSKRISNENFSFSLNKQTIEKKIIALNGIKITKAGFSVDNFGLKFLKSLINLHIVEDFCKLKRGDHSSE